MALPLRTCTHTQCGRTKSSSLSAATHGRPSLQIVNQRTALGCARTQCGSARRSHCTRWDTATHDAHSCTSCTLPEACGTKQPMSMSCPARASCLTIWTHQQAFGAHETLALLTRLPCVRAADDVAGWQANGQCWRNHSVQRLLLSVVLHACIELREWLLNDEFELQPSGAGCLPACMPGRTCAKQV